MKKIVLRIIAAISAFLLLAFIFSIANAFVGNPISKAFATHKIKSYVHENFSDMDLELSKTVYNFKFDQYYVKAQSKTSKDTHFELDYSNGKVTDTYKNDVLSGWNTFKRLDEEFNHVVERLIKDNMSYEFYMLFGTLDKMGKYQTSNLKLDMDFDIANLPLDGYITAYPYSADVSWNNVAKISLELDQLMQANNINIKQYDVILEPLSKKEDKADESLGVYDFPQEMLTQDNLPMVMENYFEKWEAAGDAEKKKEMSNATKIE